ncbi:MAG: hypothetical protein NVV66_09220 [Cellulomonas sp.]|uniref:hypothetical protein n=1 Tax=Cellulomonas sp. TaxID=40001 RepID=UPI00258C2E94|nr:hypothetical protein [Cellulomonas sp.]MCR6704852.1 hypothetical protein [Cellulomonas sp.]
MLQQRLRRIDAAPGEGHTRTKRAVSDIAGQLAEAVADAIPDVEPPTPTAIEVVGLGAEQRDDLLQELRWRTDDGLECRRSRCRVPRRWGSMWRVERRVPSPTGTGSSPFVRPASSSGSPRTSSRTNTVLLDAPRADCEVVDYDAKTGAFERATVSRCVSSV